MACKFCESVLSWEFDRDESKWTADSAHSPYGAVRLSYVIGVCDDGTFDIMSDTDRELLMKKKVDCFPSLDAAKAWCQANEKVVDFSEVGR